MGRPGDHSAVTTSQQGVFISKWGECPLMRHAWNYGPYGTNNLKYYKKTYKIIGPNSVCQGDEAIYTLINSGNNDVITWSTDKKSDSGSAPNPQLFKNTPAHNQCKITNRYGNSLIQPITLELRATINNQIVATKLVVGEKTNSSMVVGKYWYPLLGSTQYSIPSSGRFQVYEGQLVIIEIENAGDKPITYNGPTGSCYPAWQYFPDNRRLHMTVPMNSCRGLPYGFKFGEYGTCGYFDVIMYPRARIAKRLSDVQGLVDIEIYSLYSGQCIYSEQSVDFGAFDISRLYLNSGIYVLKVKSGDDIITEKIDIGTLGL